MIKIEGYTIHCTRGDEDEIDFNCEDDNGNAYHFEPGQTVILKVFNKKNYEDIVLKKVVTVEETCTSVSIPLTSEDTTIGELINKPVTYHYEISIDDKKTIIGYDEEGPKQFILYPEGGE